MNRAQLRRLLCAGTGAVPQILFLTDPVIRSSTPGLYQDGVGLECLAPIVTPAGALLDFQWLRSDTGAAIAGAVGQTYTPAGDAGHSLVVRVTATFPGAAPAVVFSQVVGPVQAADVSEPPVLVSDPAVVSADPGVYRAGVALQAVMGGYQDPVTLVARQWLVATSALGAGAAPIAGAAGPTLTPGPGQVAAYIGFDETVTADGEFLTSRSGFVGPIADVVLGDNDPALSAAQIDATGARLQFAVSAGAWAGQKIVVDPGLVSVTMDAPSAEPDGTPVTATLVRRVGRRAEFAAGVLSIWLAQPIPASAANVQVTMLAGAVACAGAAVGDWAGPVANASEHVVPRPSARLCGIVQGRHDLRYAHCAIDGPFTVEAKGGHADPLACVVFTVTGGATTLTYAVTDQVRSRYQDRTLVDDAQWAENAGGGAQGGIGVWATPLIDNALLPEGPVTVSAAFISVNGGPDRARVETWSFANDRGGYVERVRYVDKAAGSDANNGLTAATAYQTVEKACLNAGAVTASGGAVTAKTIPIVRCVGSGDPGAPAVYELYSGAGTGSAVPGGTDVWLTLEPAEGHDGDDTWIANYSGIATGWGSRIRRLRIRRMGWDIANAAGAEGVGSKSLVNNNGTVYPSGNSAALAFEDVRRFHHLGAAGQLTMNAPNMVGTSYNKATRLFLVRHECTELGQTAIQTQASLYARDSYVHDVAGDMLKQPDCLVACRVHRNINPPVNVPLLSVSGTFSPGDTVTGLISGFTRTVAQIIPGAGTNATLIVDAPHVYGFKPDDAKTHQYVAVAGQAGVFTVGESVRNAAGTQVGLVRAVGAGFLRVSMTLAAAFGNAQALTGQSSGATATTSGASVTRGNMICSSGATATLSLVHPDVIQIQTFASQQLRLTGVVGAFRVDERVYTDVLTGQAALDWIGRVLRIEANGDLVVSTSDTFFTKLGHTLIGETSGAQATLAKVTHVDNDYNAVVANADFRGHDGTAVISENGLSGFYYENLLGARIDTSQSARSGMGSVYAVVFRHCTMANQAIVERSIADLPVVGCAIQGCVAKALANDVVAAGAGSGDDGGGPGYDWWCNHSLRSDQYSTMTVAEGITTGEPVWVDGVLSDEDYDPFAPKDDYTPAPGAPLARIPAGRRLVRYDIFGRERPDDGTACAGAVAV